MSSKLGQRGANAKQGARLPSLEAVRAGDPQVQKALESIREWLEVRLGTRGDPYERAVTQRDLEQALAPLADLLKQLGDFDGTLSRLSAVPVGVVPSLRVGAFEQLGDDLYYCNGKAWKRVTLA